MINLKKLTPRGMKKLNQDIAFLTKESYPEINIEKYESTIVSEFKIDEKKVFKNKFNVGEYFLNVFEKTSPDYETWNWLSLLYYKQLLNQKGKIGELERLFIFESKIFFNVYVHLLKIPYDICWLHKDSLDEIEFLLSDPVNINGTIYLEISKRNDITENKNFLNVVRKLFYDKKNNSFRKGEGVKKAIKRLIQLYRQYERSFDLYHMSSEEFINLLSKKHKEFKPFL